MKKILIGLMVLTLLSLSGCGMSFKQSVKNFQADLGGGLDRKIVIENTRTGEDVFVFEGKAYIADGSIPGDVTIVCTMPDGSTKKVDFIGRDYGVQSFEK